MSEKVLQLRGRIPDSEKITINLGYVDLGRIDLLVQEGFYSNRTDFIRAAIVACNPMSARRVIALTRQPSSFKKSTPKRSSLFTSKELAD